MINFFNYQNFNLLNYSNFLSNGFNFQFFSPFQYSSGNSLMKFDNDIKPTCIYVKKKDIAICKSTGENSSVDSGGIALNILRSMSLKRYPKKGIAPEASVLNKDYNVSFSRAPLQSNGIEFLNKTKEISKKLNCDYRDLLAVMNIESRLNPRAINKKSGATGLLQFMPKTASALGTTTQEIKQMDSNKQLDFVEKYLLRAKSLRGFSHKHKLTAGELYALVFLPSRAKRDVLCYRGEKSSDGKLLKYYEWNKGLDTNKDGKITKAELNARVKRNRINENLFA